MKPYEDIAFAMVVWNDAKRAEKLLRHVRPWFKTVAVAVQDSPDDTLKVVQDIADIVVRDGHHGFGDASFGPKLLPNIRQTWTFKVDADEWPDEDCLAGLGDAVKAADAKPTKGVWIPFRSWVDDAEWEEQHAHLRLFHTRLGWPGTLHSRPPVEDGLAWDRGHIHHKRSLDEMIKDYLNYLEVGRGNASWTEHNTMMMREACLGAARRRGWAYVTANAWWPEVKRAAFNNTPPKTPIYCSGVNGSGTRMLYDMVQGLGYNAIHATIPGWPNQPDMTDAFWGSRETWEKRYGPGRWVVIDRGVKFSRASARRRHLYPSDAAYDIAYWQAKGILDGIHDAYRVSYEAFVKDPELEYGKLAAWLGCCPGATPVIYNGNAR